MQNLLQAFNFKLFRFDAMNEKKSIKDEFSLIVHALVITFSCVQLSINANSMQLKEKL